MLILWMLILCVKNDIMNANPEYVKNYEEYLRDNEEKLEGIVSQF